MHLTLSSGCEAAVLTEAGERGLNKASRSAHISCRRDRSFQSPFFRRQMKDHFCDSSVTHSLSGRWRSILSRGRRVLVLEERLQTGWCWQTVSCPLLWMLHRQLKCSILHLHEDKVKLYFRWEATGLYGRITYTQIYTYEYRPVYKKHSKLHI